MGRPVAFDMTHVVSRLPVGQPSGIDKVDLAYAQHYAARPCAASVHYGIWSPKVHEAEALARTVAIATRSRWTAPALDRDPAYQRVYQALTEQLPRPTTTSPETPPPSLSDAWGRRLSQWRWRFGPGSTQVPPHAIYLNVAQHAFEFPRFFRWLPGRPDIVPVFLVHDLLPLDYPEYFLPGYEKRFSRRVATIITHGRALITTTEAVRARLEQAISESGRPSVPIHVEPLPSSLPGPSDLSGDPDPLLASSPYFVILGTIEPRKNHLLLLNIWRRLAQEQSHPPKLVIIGTRGWENEQILDVLDRSALVRPHVVESTGLSDRGLRKLLVNARALLMPSFAEGYGLPVVEALSVGTPVVASDIPVFREVAQGRALLRHPLDGPGWRDAILALADRTSSTARQAKTAAQAFEAPTWSKYFKGIDAFLAGL